MTSQECNTSVHVDMALPYRIALVCIYSLVLIIGTAGLGLMIHIVNSNMRSVIIIAMLNLSLAHLFFLVTVPFRIYYYSIDYWGLGEPLCKFTSAMIHMHMYLVFVFYVVILIIRLLGFHSKKDRYEFYRKLHAFGASVAVWVLVSMVVWPVLYIKYGKMHTDNTTGHSNNTTGHSNNHTRCFRFGKGLCQKKVQVLNYILSSVTVIAASVLFALQCHVVFILVRKYGRDCTSHQEFWAQLKSLCIAMVLLVCFVPYQAFRIHYLRNLHLEDLNEVFLSFTALSCGDMLTFLGRRHCNLCDRIRTA
ncbi:probable G-protein coupled receptor 141 [Esox lucius]|uniref:probable G-protein coupled receptor 141 n=1 Tax=Esox lucius TaxID=8010 RepID=UPI0014771F0E|nr:probable G-protein coupled receptor 141 [Esox lucius]